MLGSSSWECFYYYGTEADIIFSVSQKDHYEKELTFSSVLGALAFHFDPGKNRPKKTVLLAESATTTQASTQTNQQVVQTTEQQQVNVRLKSKGKIKARHSTPSRASRHPSLLHRNSTTIMRIMNITSPLTISAHLHVREHPVAKSYSFTLSNNISKFPLRHFLQRNTFPLRQLISSD
jgi:hypothetical protein